MEMEATQGQEGEVSGQIAGGELNNPHLPDCPVPQMHGVWGLPLHPEDAELNCICAALRACEQRVLDAAREAVLKVDPNSRGSIRMNCAAAIDALREEIK